MAADEPVTSPDQHKPTPVKAARVAAVVTIFLLIAMLFGNNEVDTGAPWLIGIAGVIALILISDAVLRRNGLR